MLKIFLENVYKMNQRKNLEERKTATLNKLIYLTLL